MSRESLTWALSGDTHCATSGQGEPFTIKGGRMRNIKQAVSRIIKITDNDGLIQEGDKLWKEHHCDRRHNIHYVEIDGEEYDKRVEELSNKIMACPDVDLSSVVKDALYDLPLGLLDKIEERLNTALEEAKKTKVKPKVKTTAKNRGTCVNLCINEKFAVNLRE